MTVRSFFLHVHFFHKILISCKCQRPYKLRSYIFLTVYSDFSAHFFDNPFYNGQSQSGAFVFSSAVFVFLGKLFEHVLLKFFAHTDSGICHFKSATDMIHILFCDLCGNLPL